MINVVFKWMNLIRYPSRATRQHQPIWDQHRSFHRLRHLMRSIQESLAPWNFIWKKDGSKIKSHLVGDRSQTDADSSH